MRERLILERIPISGPWITAKEVEYVADAAANSWYSNANNYNERFERSFAEYLGVQYAVTLPSCTSAIHLSLLALGVGPGDEVIVPEITWIATAAPVSYVGAKPVFADIEPDTWCLSPESFEKNISPRTKAVIPVDLYGGSSNWEKILEIAKRKSIYVIEDAAEAIGTEYRNRKAGSFGDTGVFSFHGSKTLTTGEGGMLVSNSQEVWRRVLFLRDHGRGQNDKMFFNSEVAYKYKMSSMQAALGLAQLERIEELVERKRLIYEWYSRELCGIEGLSLNYEPEGTKNTYWMVTIILDEKFGLGKIDLQAKMSEKGIDCRPFFYPLSYLPAYKGLEQARKAAVNNKNSYRISPYGVNLPSGLNLSEEKVHFISSTLLDILNL